VIEHEALFGEALDQTYRCRQLARIDEDVVGQIELLQRSDAALELGMLPRRLGGILLWLERFILARATLVTTVSAAMQRRLTAKCHTRQAITMFPNWADVASMCPWEGVNRYRQQWTIDERTLVVMYSGNLGRKQGIEVLLEAVTKVRTPHLLVIAGEGAERAELEQQANKLGIKAIRFVPLVPSERLAEFLSAGDVHCIPQRRAAAGLVMPSKLLNLMAVAKPVVVTAPAGSDLAQVVAQAACGIAVEPEEPQQLAMALEKLLNDDLLRRQSGLNGRHFVHATYEANTVLRSFAHDLITLMHVQRN
jgi:colanic acid biosynthesis glycosyl transferase WcaI